jgi:hypothetical protein
MKFLITDHGHLLKVKESRVAGVFLTERCTIHYTERFGIVWPSSLPIRTDLPDLPKEIWEMIAEYLVYDYLRKGLTPLAIDLITLFSQSFTRKIYHTFFGSCYFSPPSIIRERLSNVIFIATGIQQEVLARENTDGLRFFSIKLQFKDPYLYLPWELASEEPFEYELNKMGRPLDMEGFPRFEGFPCGETFGDVVWLQGEHDDNCMFESTRSLYPMINLFIPSNHVFDWRKDYVRNLPAWVGFNKFLRMMFGPNTGLFYAISRQFGSTNPFNLILQEANK